MNTFSAFRFAARTLLQSTRSSPNPSCSYTNPIALHRSANIRFKHSFRSRLRDELIPYTAVTLVEDDNNMVKTSLKRLLKNINRDEFWLELVSEDPEPLVKLVNKKAALEAQKKLKESQRESARKNVVKEVQLTWSSEPGDLEHKLARMRSYLEMGAKVDIVFSTKPKTKPPPPSAQQEKVQEIIQALADVSKEMKEVEWRKNMAAISLQGTGTGKPTAKEEEDAGSAQTVAETNEQAPEIADASAASPPAPSTPKPARERDVVDLAEFGFMPPLHRRNPLSGMKKEKKYGKRSANSPG